MASKFTDGIRSFISSLVDSRNTTSQNYMYSPTLSAETLRQIYRSGVGNKIVRIKSGHALNETLQFDTEEQELVYNNRLSKHVKNASKWMIAFGRGVVMLHHPGDKLDKALVDVDLDRMMIKVFSGDMVTTGRTDINLESPRYLKPETYIIRGQTVHYSRIIDFTYVQPPELDAPKYQYGGISEFELIYEQLIADGVVQRASPRILEKASSMFYKVKGFKDAMRTGQETDMVNYFSQMENLRGIFAAGLVDADDTIEVVSQSISNLSEADQITLRRLAMVTSIPLAMLVGENVKGLNSTGDNERQVFQDMIEAMQSEYLIEPINELMAKVGQGVVSFKENQGDTPTSRIEYEGKAIANAVALNNLGEDYSKYLEDKGIIMADVFDDLFSEVDDQAAFADEFKEEEHKRDGGKFAKKEGSKKEGEEGKEKFTAERGRFNWEIKNEEGETVGEYPASFSKKDVLEKHKADGEKQKENKKNLKEKTKLNKEKREKEKAIRENLSQHFEEKRELIENVHMNKNLQFHPMSEEEFSAASTLPIYRSRSFGGKKGSEYRLVSINGKPAYAREADHWGAFSTSDYVNGERVDTDHKWDLPGAKTGWGNKERKAGYILLEDLK